MATYKARVYSLKLKKLELLGDEVDIVDEEAVIVYYSGVYRTIIVISAMEENTKFWRKLRLKIGQYIIHNNDLKSMHIKKGTPTDRILRYNKRVQMVQEIFKIVEANIKHTKK